MGRRRRSHSKQHDTHDNAGTQLELRPRQDIHIVHTGVFWAIAIALLLGLANISGTVIQCVIQRRGAKNAWLHKKYDKVSAAYQAICDISATLIDTDVQTSISSDRLLLGLRQETELAKRQIDVVNKSMMFLDDDLNNALRLEGAMFNLYQGILQATRDDLDTTSLGLVQTSDKNTILLPLSHEITQTLVEQAYGPDWLQNAIRSGTGPRTIDVLLDGQPVGAKLRVNDVGVIDQAEVDLRQLRENWEPNRSCFRQVAMDVYHEQLSRLGKQIAR